MFKYVDLIILGLLAGFMGLASVGSQINHSNGSMSFAIIMLYIIVMMIIIFIGKNKKKNIIRYCSHCGNTLSVQASFCGRCGQPQTTNQPIAGATSISPVSVYFSPEFIIPIITMVIVTNITKDKDLIGGIILVSIFLVLRVIFMLIINYLRTKIKYSDQNLQPNQPTPAQMASSQTPPKKNLLKKIFNVYLLIWFVILIPFLLLFSLIIIYIYIGRPFQVKGTAMYPTYKNGQTVFTRTVSQPDREIIRGEVYILISPSDSKKDLIKRVIGLPGETVELKNGRVYINNQPLDESSYIKDSQPTLGGNIIKDNQAVVIPQGEYFVLGDDRSQSSDSRDFGFVPKDNFQFRVLFCYWNCK